MARKLASIEKVWKIEPIEGADNIELAHVLGWQCVVNKGQFKPMDLGVYFEIDSFLPIRPEFEFLRSSSYRNSDILGEGFKLKTMRFKGQLSQGLLLPVSLFPQLAGYNVGRGVAEELGVKKWEIEERATTGGNVIGELPFGVDPAAGDVDVPVQVLVSGIAVAYQGPLKSFQILFGMLGLPVFLIIEQNDLIDIQKLTGTVDPHIVLLSVLAVFGTPERRLVGVNDVRSKKLLLKRRDQLGKVSIVGRNDPVGHVFPIDEDIVLFKGLLLSV